MDWRLFHDVNVFMRHHSTLERVTNDVETATVLAIGIGAFALWLLARPGGARRWKLASASALASAALALLLNTQLIARIWHRDRPYETHHGVYHPYVHSHDPSFPSDHASAAFGIAFAVALFDRALGAAFLAVAVVIGVGRVALGAHYPGDVAGGLGVGVASALVVVAIAHPLLELLVRLVERVTDPLLAPLWRLRTPN